MTDDLIGERYTGGTIAISEAEQDENQVLATAQQWVDVEFEVALDSGSTDNLCHPEDAPGYIVEAPQGSKQGRSSCLATATRSRTMVTRDSACRP